MWETTIRPLSHARILFDADGEAGAQRTLDAVLPFALIRVAVVGVEKRAVVIQQVGLPERAQGRDGQHEIIVAYPTEYQP